MLSGKLAYETFKTNARHAVPSIISIDRYIAKVKSTVVEGVLRIDALLEYLTARQLPKRVALSEDATRITNRIQYDPRTNQLVGFVLPLGENGMPITGSNKARSAAEMEKCFYDVTTSQEKNRASYLNVIMAQPLVTGTPAFCLLLFGTDAKYTSADIAKRWQFIVDELRKKNIEVATFASDSDPKFNSVMRSHLELGQNRYNDINFPEWFNAKLCLPATYIPIQDTVHIGTKFRNRILNCTLKMGKYDITINHIASLIESFTKEKHNLCLSTIKLKDRQNFESVMRICDDKVIDLLSSVSGSDGTILYLKVLSNILRSFLDLRLTPIERIRHIWFAIFVLRIWKKFILQSKKKYTVADHFITQNCYACVEINAHAIVFLMLYLKERKLDHLFHSEMLGSQQCESMFRQIRSLTSAYSTVTNGSLLEIISRISKIELQNDISHIKLKHFNFPRIGLPSSSFYPRVNRNGLNPSENFVPLPSQQEIIQEIEMAKLEAIEYAETLGMCVEKSDEYVCVFEKPVVKEVQQNEQCNIESVVQSEHVLQLFSEINFKQYAKKIDASTINEESPYVKVQNKNGEILCIEKHTLCWLLGKSTTKLSSDRLIRVMTRT